MPLTYRGRGGGGGDTSSAPGGAALVSIGTFHTDAARAANASISTGLQLGDDEFLAYRMTSGPLDELPPAVLFFAGGALYEAEAVVPPAALVLGTNAVQLPEAGGGTFVPGNIFGGHDADNVLVISTSQANVEVAIEVFRYASSDAAAVGGGLSAADRAKLDGIEAGATADLTGAEIKATYEAEADTNAFTNALLAKLTAIEAGATADLTGLEIVALINAVLGQMGWQTAGEGGGGGGVADGVLNMVEFADDGQVTFTRSQGAPIVTSMADAVRALTATLTPEQAADGSSDVQGTVSGETLEAAIDAHRVNRYVWLTDLRLDYRDPEAGVEPQFSVVFGAGSQRFLEFHGLSESDQTFIRSVPAGAVVELQKSLFTVTAFSVQADGDLRLAGAFDTALNPALVDTDTYRLRFTAGRPTTWDNLREKEAARPSAAQITAGTDVDPRPWAVTDVEAAVSAHESSSRALDPIAWADATEPTVETLGRIENIEGVLYEHDQKHHAGHGKTVAWGVLADANFRGFHHRSSQVSNPVNGNFYVSIDYGDFEIRRNDRWVNFSPFEAGEVWGGAAVAVTLDDGTMANVANLAMIGVELSRADAFARASANNQVFGNRGNHELIVVTGYVAPVAETTDYYRRLYHPPGSQGNPRGYWYIHGATERWPDDYPYNVVRVGDKLRIRWAQDDPNQDVGDFANRVGNIWLVDVSADIDAANPGTANQVFSLPAGRYRIKVVVGSSKFNETAAFSVGLVAVRSGTDDYMIEQTFSYSRGEGVGSSGLFDIEDIDVDGTEEFYVLLEEDEDNAWRGYLRIERILN